MSNYLFNSHQQNHQHPQNSFHSVGHPHHNHHGGRSRRAPRLASAHNPQRQQFRTMKTMREMVPENPTLQLAREKYEWGRSFDLEDDFEFCPELLTDEEVCYNSSFAASHWRYSSASSTSSTESDKAQQYQTVQSSASDRSSLSSGSPDSSPLQHQIHPSQQVTPALSLPSTSSNSYVQPTYNINQNNLKLHQPSAVRTRNAIPIVNPSTGMRVSSPPTSIPSSISPGMMQQTTAARRW